MLYFVTIELSKGNRIYSPGETIDLTLDELAIYRDRVSPIPEPTELIEEVKPDAIAQSSNPKSRTSASRTKTGGD